MNGITFKNAPADWEILQQIKGTAKVSLTGSYLLPTAALEVGTAYAIPVLRVVREEDNTVVIPWTAADYCIEDPYKVTGSWNISFTIPSGGLYRIESGLDAASSDGTYSWMFRGDIRFHIGVGNLFVIAGQSNAAGFGQDWDYDPPSLNVHVLRNNKTWSIAAHPINESTDADMDNENTEIRVTGTSPFLSFGRIFNELSGYPVGLIPAAKGGSAIDLWDKQGTGILYQNMFRKLVLCNNQIAGILWYQGCSDTSDESAALYDVKYQRFIHNVREDLGYQVPFFTFQLNREINSLYEEGWAIVRESQRKAALEIQDVYVLPTLDASLSDNIHNNSRSNVHLGARMARLCGYVLCDTAPFMAPDIDQAILLNEKQVLLKLLHSDNGFQLLSSFAEDCGFLLEDKEGVLPTNLIIPSKESPAELIIELKRKPLGNIFISFCHKSVPSVIPPLEAATFLPPLSFYHFPVKVDVI